MAGAQQSTDYPRAGAAEFSAGGRHYRAVPMTPGQPAPPQYGYAEPPTWVDTTLETARRTHSRGATAYLLGWIAIPVGIVLLGLTMAVIISGFIGGASIGAGTMEDFFFATLGFLGIGMVLRGVGFSLMMRADFLIRSQVWSTPG